MAEILLMGQGVYYLLSGLWPLVHIRSFLAVTGPKTDLWLIKTVGILITVIGAAMTIAGTIGEISMAILVLAIGSALALTGVDVIYVAAGRISRIYLLDAVVELMFLVAWSGALIAV